MLWIIKLITLYKRRAEIASMQTQSKSMPFVLT